MEALSLESRASLSPWHLPQSPPLPTPLGFLAGDKHHGARSQLQSPGEVGGSPRIGLRGKAADEPLRGPEAPPGIPEGVEVSAQAEGATAPSTAYLGEGYTPDPSCVLLAKGEQPPGQIRGSPDKGPLPLGQLSAKGKDKINLQGQGLALHPELVPHPHPGYLVGHLLQRSVLSMNLETGSSEVVCW